MDDKRIAYTLSLLARAMKKGKELEQKKQPSTSAQATQTDTAAS